MALREPLRGLSKQMMKKKFKKKNLDRRIETMHCTHHVYLISYIWYATKENKLDQPTRTRTTALCIMTQGCVDFLGGKILDHLKQAMDLET
jgi:hypothetical protein